MVSPSTNSHNFPLKLLCSYGGKIIPRQTDGKLRYYGGETRVLSVDRCISFAGSIHNYFHFICYSVFQQGPHIFVKKKKSP